MDPEVIILCVVSQKRQISDDITYMWKLNYDTNELINKTEIDSQTEKTNLWLPEGKGKKGYIRSLGLTYTHYSLLFIK